MILIFITQKIMFKNVRIDVYILCLCICMLYVYDFMNIEKNIQRYTLVS